MRVLFVEPFGHYGGHLSSYPKYLSRALAEVGANVTMVSFKGFLDENSRDEKIEYLSATSGRGAMASLARLSHKCVTAFNTLSRFGTLVETFFAFSLALRENRRQEFDTIHILDASLMPLSFFKFASAVRDKSLVLTLSNPPFEQLEKHSLIDSTLNGLRKMLQVLEKPLYRKASHKNNLAFVCQSWQVQESYKRNSIYDRLATIPWGIESVNKKPVPQSEARQYLGLAQYGQYLLSFGINHPRKNFEVVFQAVRDLPRDFKLLFVGKIMPQDAQLNDPARLAREYGWADNTIIVDDFVPEDDMLYYFSAADAIILSYRGDFIGASGVLSHSGTFGLPVIASDVGQLGEFVKESELGLTFVPEDTGSLREAIMAFLKLSGEEKDRMKQNLAQFALSHSWEHVAKEHIELYQTLLQEWRGSQNA